jgi:hypothetical protein
LLRPRFFSSVVRVDPPASVTELLLEWACEALWTSIRPWAASACIYKLPAACQDARAKAKSHAAGHKPTSLGSDDDAFDGDFDEEEVAVQEWAL